MKKVCLSFLIVFLIGTFCTYSVEAKSMDAVGANHMLVDKYKTDYHRDDDFTGNCADFASTIRMGGYVIYLVKIVLPLFIIVKASMNLFSLVANGKPDEFKKQMMKFAYSCAAAIIIFFVPTIVDTIFGFVGRYNTGKTSDTEICVACVFEPFGNTCKTYAE